MLVCCRMGLEALVESYAFWRPSLRTLTFEDIPGITKQGTICMYVFVYHNIYTHIYVFLSNIEM